MALLWIYSTQSCIEIIILDVGSTEILIKGVLVDPDSQDSTNGQASRV